MPDIHVENVPERVHRVLVQHASRRGQSLQQYVNDQLARMAERPCAEEVFERIEARGLNRTFSLTDAVSYIRADRDRASSSALP